LQVIFNPSQINGTLQEKPINHLEPDMQRIRTATEIVFSHLEQAGIQTDYNQMKVSRIDITQDTTTEHETETYFPALSILGGSRLKKRNEPTTYYHGNSQRQICTYDKTSHIFDLTNGNGIIEPNTTRMEVRALNSRETAKILNVNRFNDVLQITTDNLRNIYTGNLKTNLFHLNPHSSNMPATITPEQMNNLIDYFGGYRQFNKIIQKSALLEYYRTPERMKQALAQAGMKRAGINKLLKNSQQSLVKKSIIESYRNPGNTLSLLNELRYKFTA
ncbi:MAG: phage/plasmid replication protein, partial [Bacteroidota bacterium]